MLLPIRLFLPLTLNTMFFKIRIRKTIVGFCQSSFDVKKSYFCCLFFVVRSFGQRIERRR